MTNPNITIASLHGGTPLQGEGMLADGRHFYFRARYEMWQMLVGKTADEAISAPTWGWSEPWGDAPFAASYMPEEEGRAIIESVGEMIAQGVAPPQERAGMPGDEVDARSLARFIANDICSYHGDAIRGAASSRAARVAVAPQIEEGRVAYQQRVAPELHALFDEALVYVDACRTNELVRENWLLDEESARSVGRRWAFMATRAAPSRREAVLAEGTRWIIAWTPEGKVRDAALAPLATLRG